MFETHPVLYVALSVAEKMDPYHSCILMNMLGMLLANSAAWML